MVGEKDEEVVTFEFPIRDPGGVTQIQYVPPSVFPSFYGLENEYPDEFLFQLEMICRAYNVQSMNFFPLTLKGASLQWFMSLGGNCIQTWEDMKCMFLKRYQEYCTTNEDILEIT